jgi:hypothetical protein
MYTIVPFLPAITIQTINDHYQQIKSLFNAALASLPPNAIASDSIEYINASNIYNESMSSLLMLLLSKRVALYFLATVTTCYAGWLASKTICAIDDGCLGGPGEALDNLNKEVLKGKKSPVDLKNDKRSILDKDVDDHDEDDDEEDKFFFATLVDDNPQSTKVGNAIALILPILLGSSLALSYALISSFNYVEGSSGAIGSEYWMIIQGLLPYLTSLPSMALCLLFVATEFRSISNNAASPSTTNSTSSLFCQENIAALLYVAGAYVAKVYPTISIGEWNLDLGPLQNGVNIAFAATVVRALAPFLMSYTSPPPPPPPSRAPPPSSVSYTSSSSTVPPSSPITFSISIRTMALALIGVTMFDGISVFGTVANAASSIDTTVAVAPTATSVMEKVATYKIGSSGAQLWNPGLLSVIVGHNDNARITEALGLGDVVFPACLAAWGFVADTVNITNENEKLFEEEFPKKKNRISYAVATTVGYIIGSAVTEIVGSFSLMGSGRGLPALIFLIPSMLLAVMVVSSSREEFNEVWGHPNVYQNNEE